ncbi:hypothetical protein SCHPADRAFT_941956 [Schizopora paradoxa]|uniref:Uncharacterized protein n=1 Tax=Schizopora paradoxa TaxID=27342 RepID=A0A0H2S3N0_9AGAM|nr:hypothetical protein SCHPADRAFT_941956 [Schizopora paradoxa]
MLFAAALIGGIALSGGLRTALAQEASTLFVIGFAGPSNELSGAVAGAGPESTTYILNGVEPDGATDVPFTLTLVEGASGISETIDIPTLSSFGGEVVCGFIGADAVCTESASQGEVVSAETTTVSFTADVAVTLTTGGASSSLVSLTAPVSNPSVFSGSASSSGSQSLAGSLAGSSSSPSFGPLSDTTLSLPATIETITAPLPTSPTPSSSGAMSRFASSGSLPLLATMLSIGTVFWHLM